MNFASTLKVADNQFDQKTEQRRCQSGAEDQKGAGQVFQFDSGLSDRVFRRSFVETGVGVWRHVSDPVMSQSRLPHIHQPIHSIEQSIE